MTVNVPWEVVAAVVGVCLTWFGMSLIAIIRLYQRMLDHQKDCEAYRADQKHVLELILTERDNRHHENVERLSRIEGLLLARGLGQKDVS